MSVAWSESSAAADLRDNVQTWRMAGLRGDALLDAFRELTTLEFLCKCSPASFHNLRLFLFDNGVSVNMRVGFSSFYAVRALLPIPASELQRDPDPTDEDVRAANERMQASGIAFGDTPSLAPLHDPNISVETANGILSIQAGNPATRVIAQPSEDQSVVHISVVETATNNSVPGLSPTVRDATTFPASYRTRLADTRGQAACSALQTMGLLPGRNPTVMCQTQAADMVSRNHQISSQRNLTKRITIQRHSATS
jgi:hypothetical protein